MSQRELFEGCIVEIRGLVSKPELNGKSAEVIQFVPQSDRFEVELLDTSAHLRVKRGNLDLIHAPVGTIVWIYGGESDGRRSQDPSNLYGRVLQALWDGPTSIRKYELELLDKGKTVVCASNAALCSLDASALGTDIMFSLGVAHSNYGQREKALACWEATLAADGCHVGALYNLGVSHAAGWAAESTLGQAQALYERAVAQVSQIEQVYL
jgi:TPR repeat protein